MTQQEALKEAQKRWGSAAWVTDSFRRNYYRISAGDGKRFGVSQSSWESAFADADRREKERTA